MSNILNSQQMVNLLKLVEESARSTEEGVKHFVEPAPGTLSRTSIRRHHIVFGRRGSGKSSLLRKAAADLTIDRRPIAFVDLEPFKGHSYPDVLISVLVSTFKEFKIWMDTAAIHPATKTSFWQKLFGTTPKRSSFNRTETSRLSSQIELHIKSLETELHKADDVEMRVLDGAETAHTRSAGVKATAEAGGSSVGADYTSGNTRTQTQEVEEKYKRSKVDFLHRHIIEYQQLFNELGRVSNGDAYLFLDDLYHIRRADQANVVDYFHRLAKGHGLWLKVGTIRHRTRWYIPGDPPMGMKIADDADEIDLDLTLEKYSTTKNFLKRVLTNFATASNAGSLDDFLTDGALDRLVLACGGVARDFLLIFRRSVDVARERRADKVSAEDVNVAAGESNSAKRAEFQRDTLDDSSPLEESFSAIRNFCIDQNNTNCFLLDKERSGVEVNRIRELVDLKLIHLVSSRVTVSGRPGKIYEAFMLDLSEYTGARKRRKLNMIEFWKPDKKESLRKSSLIYNPATQIGLT